MKKKKSLNQILCLTYYLGGIGLSLFSIKAQAEGPRLQGYVMQVQLTPAVCSLDASRQKQRKCLEGYSLTINGLLPEVVGQACETQTPPALSPLQAKVVARVMPDENARIALWRSVGGCIPMSASQYFRMIINYAERLKIPVDLTNGTNKEIKKNYLKQQFVRLNPSLPASSIQFSCQSLRSANVLTEVQVCYQVNGSYKQCSNRVASNCPDRFIIQSSY